MAGHIREKRWLDGQNIASGEGVSTTMKQCACRVMEQLEEGEYVYLKMEELWRLASGDPEYRLRFNDSPNDIDQSVADQLFEELYTNGPNRTPQATADQVAMVVHVRRAAVVLRDLSQALKGRSLDERERKEPLMQVSW